MYPACTACPSAQNNKAQLPSIQRVALSILVAAEGLEPQETAPRLKANAGQFCAKPLQNKPLNPSSVKLREHNSTDSIHSHSTSERPKCVPDVYQTDLAQVAAAWEGLSADAKRQILAIVNAEG